MARIYRPVFGVACAECEEQVPHGRVRVQAAIMVAKIATGEIEEKLKELSGKVRSGKAGAKARAEKLTGDERSAIAKKAAGARWGT